MILAQKHQRFRKTGRKHVLLITNHGCHSPVITVTTDTGGQNFYVNDLAKALVELNFKVTIINRGGYNHPETNQRHEGILYFDNVWGEKGQYARLMYLEDGVKAFIPKEKITVTGLKAEADFFFSQCVQLGENPGDLYFINSHYWDGGQLGVIIHDHIKAHYKSVIPHVWTPHSLGRLKRDNYKSNSPWSIRHFNFPSRINYEEKVIASVDGVTSTSNKIRHWLGLYNARVKCHFWHPPGINTELFKPRSAEQCGLAYEELSHISGMSIEAIKKLVKKKVVFLEVSRTTTTKRKDLLLQAFDYLKNPEAALFIMAVDHSTEVYDQIVELYQKMKNKDRVFLLDRYLSKEVVSEIFSLADVYITASVMEGWGMAVQQGAAAGAAIISSKFVPFVTEVLKDAALIVNKNDPKLYAEKMEQMINDKELRETSAHQVYEITVGEYSWHGLARRFISMMIERGLLER